MSCCDQPWAVRRDAGWGFGGGVLTFTAADLDAVMPPGSTDHCSALMPTDCERSSGLISGGGIRAGRFRVLAH